MSEEQMAGLVQGALAARGITDEVLAAGQFNPRGHTGGMFAGGLAGSEAGGLLGEAGEAAGLGAGSVAGMRAADALGRLPACLSVSPPRWWTVRPRQPCTAGPPNSSSRSRAQA